MKSTTEPNQTETNQSAEALAAPRALSYRQAAQRLGVSTMTLRRWVAAGRMRARRYSANCVRLPLEEVERFEREALA